jgi:hypothetical protein
MPAITQELKIGMGYKKQTNTGTTSTTAAQLQTALSEADLWCLNTNAFNVPFPQLNTEDDGAFFGKGDEYPRTLYPTSIDAAWEWPYFLTSQNFAQVINFACPKVTRTTPGVGASQYVATPPDRKTDGVNLPATTIVASVRDGDFLDVTLIGMVCTGFTLKIQRGPGLENTSIVSRWMGCGKYEIDLGLAVPELTVEQRLGAGSLTELILGGVDYFANARIVDLEYTWDNGVVGNSGYYPGSGQQSGYDIKGRMRFGRRTQSLVWSAEWEADSDELTQLSDGVESACSLIVTGPEIVTGVNHKAMIELPRTRVKALSMQEADGYMAGRIETLIMKDPTDPWVRFTAVTDKANIGVAA